MRSRPHTHPCSRCDQAVPCAGEWESNYDGYPEVICSHYHLETGGTAECVCEDCRESSERRTGPVAIPRRP